MEKEIFISYSRRDFSKVKTIKDTIDQAMGIDCWMDIDGIESGEQFKNVIIKAGPQGCYFSPLHQDGMFFEAIPVKAVDTTGAGDNFVAGFISGLLEGEAPLECCRRALLQAAKSIQHIGAVDSMKSRSFPGSDHVKDRIF